MKAAFIFLIIFLSTLAIFSQSNLAVIKRGLKDVSIYDSSKTQVIALIDSETYFYLDSLFGIWYSCNIPDYFESFVHKDSIQFFNNLSITKQRKRINHVLNKFYSICAYTLPDTLRQSTSDAYYSKAFDPILGEFREYYKKTRDTITLLNVLRSTKCSPDGGFAEQFYYLVGYCYNLDKQLFIRQIQRIKNHKRKQQLKSVLIAGIRYYYETVLGKKKKSFSEIKVFLQSEEKYINKFIN